MKKLLAILAVLALTVIGSAAMAEVTVSGSVDIRSKALNNTSDFTSDLPDHERITQERIRINVDAKSDNVKGRVTIENDWESWGSETNTTSGGPFSGAKTGVEARPGQSGLNGGKSFGFREAWIDFAIPGTPAFVKVGHQFLQLGNGWFFRSMKYGSDAWVVGLPGKNTIAFVDVKVQENVTTAADDVDAYVVLDNFKIDDTKTVGAYLVDVHDTRGSILPGTEADLWNLGLWFNGKIGPLNLQAEIDLQQGTGKDGNGVGQDTKFKGNQIVLQANMPAGPVSVNATIAQGSGQDLTSTSNDFKQFINVLDSDPHYTVVYEYFAPTACVIGSTAGGDPIYGKNTGFCNTQGLNLGVAMDVAKWLNVSLDYWMLKAVEKVNIGSPTSATLSDDIGSEIDLVAKFKIYDNLTWNWQFARLMPGDAYKINGSTKSADNMDAVQGILSYKF